jgi:hypothetical protein
MPETPEPDHTISPLPDTQHGPMTEGEETGETVDFLPPLVSRILITGWILLFSGRWLVVQGLAAAGLLGPEQVERLDDVVLGRCYLVLLSVTLVTLALRIVRGLPPEKAPLDSETGFSAPAKPDPTAVGTVEAEASARGGKQA